MNDKAKSAAGDPVATLSAELEGCRRAISYCMGIALGRGVVPGEEALFAGEPVNDFDTCFHFMELALKLMNASSQLGEAIARLKGEMRQSITVDKYNHGPSAGARSQTLSTQKLRERRENARAIQHEGEGGVPEAEKRLGG